MLAFNPTPDPVVAFLWETLGPLEVPDPLPTCETCGDEGIIVSWVHRERFDGVDWHDVDPEVHELCPDCTVFYGPPPPWADYPDCPACDVGFGVLDGQMLECVGCAHRWEPSADERVQAERADQAGRELDDLSGVTRSLDGLGDLLDEARDAWARGTGAPPGAFDE